MIVSHNYRIVIFSSVVEIASTKCLLLILFTKLHTSFRQKRTIYLFR